MTTPITIGPVQGDKSIRLAIEHENDPDLEIKHLKPGEVWSSYLSTGMRIVEISEVNIGDVVVGRSHLGRIAAPISLEHECKSTTGSTRCDTCFGPLNPAKPGAPVCG